MVIQIFPSQIDEPMFETRSFSDFFLFQKALQKYFERKSEKFQFNLIQNAE